MTVFSYLPKKDKLNFALSSSIINESLQYIKEDAVWLIENYDKAIFGSESKFEFDYFDYCTEEKFNKNIVNAELISRMEKLVIDNQNIKILFVNLNKLNEKEVWGMYSK